MPITFDYSGSVINITSPDTAVDLQVLHDAIEDEMATPQGLSYGDIIQPEGKIEDPTNPGIFSQIIVILNSPWQVQFYGGSGYTRIFGGKLIGGLNDQPIKATGTAGDITVLESPVDGLTVSSGVSGLTAAESAALLEIAQGLGLDAANPLDIEDTEIRFGTVTLTISDNGTTTTITRQP